MYRSALVLAALTLAACGTPPPVKAQNPAAPPAVDPASVAIGRATDNLVLGRCHGESGNLCYDDADGVSQFWIDSFRKIHSAEVRLRQQRYNLWIRGVKGDRSLRISFVEAPLPYQYYRPPPRTLAGNSISMPQSIRATGRFDQDTIAIPLYRAVHRLLAAQNRFERDCERDYGAGSLCNRIASSTMSKDDRAPTPTELQRYPEDFRLRVATLSVAFERSHQLAAALKAVLASAGKAPEALIMDGVNPDDLAADKLQAMDVADVLLAAAIDETEWAAESYKPIKP